MSEQRTRSLERRYDRALRWGLVVSLLAHAALFMVFDHTVLPVSPFSAAGPQGGDTRAAKGGGLETIEFRSPAEPAPAPPEPEPEATPDPVEIEPPEPRIGELGIPSPTLSDLLSVPGPVGLLDEPGLADGTGEGAGGTEEEGRFSVIPPRPRGLILPPGDRPDRVRGKEVEVWVYVSATGRVVADSTRLHPPTGDRGFDRRLRQHASGWLFEAARREGRSVGEWFRYTIIM